MSVHNSLDSEIDKILLYNLFNSPKIRQFLSYLFLIHKEILYEMDVNAKKEILQICELYESENINEILEDFSDDKLTTFCELGLIKNIDNLNKLKELISNNKKIILNELFGFIIDSKTGFVKSYYFLFDGVLEGLQFLFGNWSEKSLEKICFELESVKCLKNNIFHQIIVTNKDIDNNLMIYFPQESYIALEQLNIVVRELFIAESNINKIFNEINKQRRELESKIIQIFPYYGYNTAKVKKWIENANKKNQGTDIVEYIRQNEEEPPDILIDNYKKSMDNIFIFAEYKNELNAMLDALYKIDQIKKELNILYEDYFTENSKILYKELLNKRIFEPINIAKKVEKLYFEYITLIHKINNINLIKAKKAYHKHALAKLDKEG
ncbi:MAG: hypothetical protein ACTSRZ_05925 [Promethearchaeota archaeon]